MESLFIYALSLSFFLKVLLFCSLQIKSETKKKKTIQEVTILQKCPSWAIVLC